MGREGEEFQDDDERTDGGPSYLENPCLAPSPAELRVLRALCACGTLHAAADQLCISVQTAASHVSRLGSKSGSRSVHELMRWADRNGWLDK